MPWRVHIHACLFVLAPRSSSCSCNPVSDTDSVCIVWSNLINQHAPLFFVLVVPFFGKTTQHVLYFVVRGRSGAGWNGQSGHV